MKFVYDDFFKIIVSIFTLLNFHSLIFILNLIVFIVELISSINKM